MVVCLYPQDDIIDIFPFLRVPIYNMRSAGHLPYVYLATAIMNKIFVSHKLQ